MKIYEAFAAALLQHGVDTMFGLMGDANMVYVGNYRERGGRFIPTAHECSAVGMANAWSQASSRVGVATVTCGPGIANTFTTLVEAVRGSSEVLLLTGDAPLEPTHFQQLDLSMVAAAAGAGYEEVLDPASAIRGLNRAIQRVVAEGKPVVLNLPQSMLMLEAGEQAAVSKPARPGRLAPDPDQVDAALGLAASANRPIVLAGRGAITSGATESLTALADALAAPLATTVLAKDLFRGQTTNLGICGNLANPVATTALSEADCIIAVGASLNAYTSANGELTAGKKIVQIDDDARSFGAYTPVNQSVHGDADTVVRAMTATLSEAGHAPNRTWLDRITAELARHEPEQDFVDRSGTDTIDPRTASIRLNDVLPSRRNLVSDIGRFVHAAWPHISTPDPVGFTAMGSFGSVGLGLAGSIGMAVARPNEPTVCVIGDGGLMMNPAELATAAREQLPLIVVVYDDQCYGFEYHKMLGFGADPAHSLLSWPEISGVAQALGADSITIRKVEEFDTIPALTDNLDRPLVIVVKLDPTVNIVP